VVNDNQAALAEQHRGAPVGVVLSTPAFQGSYRAGGPHLEGRESVQLTRIDAGQRAYTLILAIVSPCAEECRLVRVIGVLIFANARTCVASVLLAAGLISHRVSEPRSLSAMMRFSWASGCGDRRSIPRHRIMIRRTAQ
jgi:hypothetical protein